MDDRKALIRSLVGSDYTPATVESLCLSTTQRICVRHFSEHQLERCGGRGGVRLRLTAVADIPVEAMRYVPLSPQRSNSSPVPVSSSTLKVCTCPRGRGRGWGGGAGE